MIVTCPRCFATYNVPESRLGGGHQVRCSSCHHTWSEAPLPHEAIAGLAPEVAEAAPQVHEEHAAPEAVHAAPKAAPVHKAAAPAKPRKPLGPMVAWVVLGLLVVLSALLLLRAPLGRHSVALADFYENIGLPIDGPNEWFSFQNVQLEKSEEGGQLVFHVQGRLHNDSHRLRALPPLKLFWRASDGHIGPVVMISAKPSILSPGDVAVFRGDLVGVDATRGGEVKVTFPKPDEVMALTNAGHNKIAPAAEHAAPAEDHAPAPEAEAAPAAPEEAAPAHEAHAPAEAPPHDPAPAHAEPAPEGAHEPPEHH